MPCLADEIAEPRPDMNIKVDASTVSEKSSNTRNNLNIIIQLNPLCLKEFHTVIIWIRPILFLRVVGLYFLILIQFLIEHSVRKQWVKLEATFWGVWFESALFAYVPWKRAMCLYGLMTTSFCVILFISLDWG